ncbi:MAG: site-2 protease family protein, partial [Thermoplasmata archaeon]
GGTALTGPDLIWGGIYFAAPLMLILGVHELAHYVVARRHHVDASLPYFLPVPPPILIFGTFGAFISLREPFPDRKALLDIGAAGPIAGFLVAIPVTLLGLHLSLSSPTLSPAFCGLTTLGVDYQNLLLGPSAIWEGLALFVPGASSNLQPLALAGWVGILVTAFNLLPAGQLDGGHIARALLGKRAVYASVVVLVVLVVLGAFYYVGWLLFAFFILFVGLRHPPPLNDLTPLGPRRVGVGVLAVAILLAGFTLVPIYEPTGSFSIANGATAPVRPLPANAGMADNLTFTVLDADVVPHAYLLSATITRVLIDQNGSTLPLSGAQLAAYAANSTWLVRDPNGNVTGYPAMGAFTEPRSDYAFVGASGHGDYEITFENPRQASVTVEVVVAQLCPEPGIGNRNSWVTTAY